MTASAELDVAVVTAYLDRVCPDLLDGPLHAELIAGGRSNLTYRLADGHHSWVLRRPPLGHVLATAHDVAREHRVMAALEGSKVPVPTVVTLCEETDVIGAPFYVMEFCRGTIYRSSDQLSSLDSATAHTISDGLVDALVDLHSTDPSAVELGDLGRP